MPISAEPNNMLYTISRSQTPLIVSFLRKIDHSDRLLAWRSISSTDTAFRLIPHS
jgi:hypothetical protein